MDIVAVIIAWILSVIGLIGAIIPWIPGPLLGYWWLIIIQIFLWNPFSVEFLVIWGAINVFVMILDYLFPLIWTKKFWGTKRGNVGCIIGTIVGIFFGPMGIIAWPFVGAFIGEYLNKKEIYFSLKAAFGSFLGFVSGVILKLVVSGLMIWEIVSVCLQHQFI